MYVPKIWSGKGLGRGVGVLQGRSLSTKLMSTTRKLHTSRYPGHPSAGDRLDLVLAETSSVHRVPLYNFLACLSQEDVIFMYVYMKLVYSCHIYC